MNRGVVQSSPVQQMMGGNPNNWWNLNNMPPPSQFFSTTPNSSFLTPYAPSSTSLPFPSWHQELPESWSHLLMSGMMGEEEKGVCKKMEKWEEQMLRESVDVKQESSYVYGNNGSNEEFQAANNWSQIVSPESCVTSFTTSMLDFSHNSTDSRPPPLDPSSECNSAPPPSGGAVKKARVQPSTSTTQSNNTFKVRKEKLGDRITALHQLVSPFGKTDTASVLLEAIGYIRFLHSQIEALSLPYLGNGSGNMRHQQSVQGEKNCIFPEHPGQLLNENSLKRKSITNDQQDSEEEPKKDLRSRGLCLVPLSCTLQVGSENGADYWAPAFGGGFG